MDDYFVEIFEGLKQASYGLVEANHGFTKLAEGLTKAAEASLHAHGEHEDLRETVKQLQTMVMDLIRRQNGGKDEK